MSRHDHAVVLGASLAGLMAARVLSEHFERVTLVEADRVATGPEPRKGVPQARHAHVLLIKGEQIASRLFPDLTDDLERGGALRIDLGEDIRWHHYGCWKTRFRSGLTGLMLTRGFLEWQVARRVAARPNVAVREGRRAGELIAAAGGRRVTGVELRLPGGGVERLAAGVVVDATGRGSQTPRRLRRLGLPAPRESRVSVDLTYTTRLHRRPAGQRPWQALLLVPRPPALRGGVILPVEGGRWIVTLHGFLGEVPPRDEAGFLDYARGLERPDLYEAIRDAEPLTEAVSYGFPCDRRRRYEDLAAMPDGLVVTGDAACSFNPVYGQGITVAALEAEALDRCLRAHPGTLEGLTPRLQRRIGRIVDFAWRMAVTEDLRYRGIAGERPPGTALLQWYLARVHRAVAADKAVARAFYQAMNLLRPPGAMFRPGIVARALLRGGGGRLRRHGR